MSDAKPVESGYTFVLSDSAGHDACERAKGTAWTVLGILPVTFFFSLFAVFGGMGQRQ